MTDKMENLAQKAYKSVEAAATAARKTVIDAQRSSRAEARIQENYRLSREAKRLKREEHLPNNAIADRMGMSESSVRALLLLRIPGEA